MRLRFWKPRTNVRTKQESRLKGEAKAQAKAYREGRRLMRQGDGMDEWIGNDIAYKAREALRSMGYDIDGSKPDLIQIVG